MAPFACQCLLLAFLSPNSVVEEKFFLSFVDASLPFCVLSRPTSRREPCEWMKKQLWVREEKAKEWKKFRWIQQCGNPILFYDFISVFSLWWENHYINLIFTPFNPTNPSPLYYSLSFAWTRKSCIVTQHDCCCCSLASPFLFCHLRLPHKIMLCFLHCAEMILLRRGGN